MDSLLKGDKLIFSIDEIYKKENNTYGVKIIPEIKSKYFPPYHLRDINIEYLLLEKEFYKTTIKEYKERDELFKGSVVQGGYYAVNTEKLRGIGIFNSKTLITSDNDIFENTKIESPYNDINIKINNVLEVDKGCDKLSEKSIQGKGFLYLYCFNVGQGDSILLITTNKNAYLIDTNINTEKKALEFYNEIKEIMNLHKLSKLTGFIVTHKHIDHIRGADRFISDSGIKIDNFLINMDYSHETKVVERLFKAANSNIQTWININSPGTIKDGDTEIIFKNPDDLTATKIVSPDINDSSISICVKYGKTRMYLTGDVGYNVLNYRLRGNRASYSENMLKVSHHGSKTGTNDTLLKNINPVHAFISVGYNKKYKHPHTEVINLLKKRHIKVNISKVVKRTICYKSNGSKIFITNLNKLMRVSKIRKRNNWR